MATTTTAPRGRAGERLASVAVYGAAPVALAAIWCLQSLDLIADTSLAVVAAILAAGGVSNYVTSAWLAREPDNAFRIQLRVAASAIGTAAAVYSVGWGSVLLVAYAVGSAELLRTAGPRTTGPNLAWNWIVIAGGELAVEFGLAPTVVRPGLAHAIAIGGACCVAIVTSVLGQATEAAERAERLVSDRALHFEALIAHAADLIGVVAVDGTIVSVSPAVTPMLGYEPDAVAGQPLSMFVEDRFAALVNANLAEAAHHVGTATSFEVRLRHADHSERLVVATLISPSDDWEGHIVINVHDITTQRDLEHRLRHDARHDALTGLMNRKAFGESSERSCAAAMRHGHAVGMLYIDLDGFKQINDSFGHDAGDIVLVEAARRLVDCLEHGETVARLGGDEFAVLIDDVRGDAAIALAETILERLGAPILGLPEDMRVGASIGIAVRSSEGIEISNLMQAADAAMYTAKRNGRCRWEMNTAPEEHHDLTTR